MADEELNLGKEEERKISEAERELERRTIRPEVPGAASGAPAKPPSFISRLFGRSVSSGQDGKGLTDAGGTEKFRVDLSDGTMRGKDLMNTSKFRHTMNDQIRGSVKSAGARKEVISRLGSRRSGGLSPREVKRELREMRREGTISRVQERNIRRDLK